MTAKESWNNGPEIQLVRVALAKLYAELSTDDILVKKADAEINQAQIAKADSGNSDVPPANITGTTVVPLNRSEILHSGMTRYDSDIHLKMQTELEAAFEHLKRC